MKYLVKISVVDNGSVSVEADSVEEAKEKAEEAYYNGQVFWNQWTYSDRVQSTIL